MHKSSPKHRSKKSKNSYNKRVPKQRLANPKVKGVIGAPDSETIDLVYPVTRNIYNAASTRASARFYTNACYDIDPLVASTTLPCFTEWSTFYNYNRVQSYQVRVSASNLEATPLSVYFVHSNTDPGTSGVSYEDYSSNAYGRQIELAGSSAQASKTVVMTHSIRQIVGDRAVQTEQNYVGLSGANPSDLTYFGIGVYNPLGNLTNGIVIQMTLRLRIRFYDRARLATFQFPLVSLEYTHTQIQDAFNLILRFEKEGRKSPPECTQLLEMALSLKNKNRDSLMQRHYYQYPHKEKKKKLKV